MPAGLPWIKLDVHFHTSRKAKALGLALNDPRAWAHVVQLWCWVAKNTPNGSVEGPDSAQIVADAAGWEGEPASFIEAMTRQDIRLLDATPNGYKIHDWEDYGGAHLEKAEKERQRLREYRTRTKGVRNSVRTGYVHGEREREREKEIKEEEASGPASPALATLPSLGGEYPVTEEQVAGWAEAYPGIDVLAEVRKAGAWLASNPSRQKTLKGMPRFLNSWLSRAQDRGVPPNGNAHPKARYREPWQDSDRSLEWRDPEGRTLAELMKLEQEGTWKPPGS